MRGLMRIPYILLALLLSGCTFGPQYSRTDVGLGQGYSEPVQAGDAITNLPWGDVFKDPVLQNLIRVSLENNRDLRLAAARVDEARARLTFTHADQFPRVDLSGNANRESPSDEIGEISLSNRNDFGVFGDLSYEIDLWGRLRRATEAERAELLSTEYGQRTVLISLVAEVASTYFSILDLQQRLNLAKGTLTNRREATKLIDLRFKGGIVPELDLNQAQIEESDVEANLFSIERELRQTEHALAVLLGASSVPAFNRETLNFQMLPQVVPAGFPADLLERRPDVLASEEQVKAAAARVGVAIAERFPRLDLLGFVGLRSDDIDNFGDGFTWGIGGSLLGPIIDFGKAKAVVEGREAEAEQALNAYEQTVFEAVREVEDSLSGIRTFQSEHAARLRQVKAASNAARLSRARYTDGVTSYLEVLDIERSLFEAELSVSQTQFGYLNSVVQLYKALGGGWEEKQVT